MPTTIPLPSATRPTAYTRFLVFVAGMGGLLYGIDIGIISAAFLYLDKTINLTAGQGSAITSAVLGGSMVSSLVAGLLADWLGRKKMLITSALLFILSVAVIVLSQSFLALLAGRLLQGMSGGVIAVVVPLYLAECLQANSRGRGTAIFQFMLTVGLVAAAIIGLFYSQRAESIIAAAAGNPGLITAARDHAWRGMFLAVVYPGLLFLLGTFFVSESPRWLFRKGKNTEALAALRRSCSEEEAQERMREMTAAAQAAPPVVRQLGVGSLLASTKSLLQRKYVVPFLLACIILGCNQATGINSILQFLVIILKQAGLDAVRATEGNTAVNVLNCLMTLVALVLVERKGRKFLLKLGTAGIIVALVLTALTFHGFESKSIDVREKVRASVVNASLSLPVTAETLGPSPTGGAMSLTVLYDNGDGDRSATVLTSDQPPILTVTPAPHHSASPLVIKRARYGPVPSRATGWTVTLLLGLFIASFAVGPGVCVWLALSELMPTRIRSTGMGIALLINQGTSTAIAAVFLPVVGKSGYASMFLFWAGCTVLYFITAAFFLPETKGKSLEEIEAYFERSNVPN